MVCLPNKLPGAAGPRTILGVAGGWGTRSTLEVKNGGQHSNSCFLSGALGDSSTSWREGGSGKKTQFSQGCAIRCGSHWLQMWISMKGSKKIQFLSGNRQGSSAQYPHQADDGQRVVLHSTDADHFLHHRKSYCVSLLWSVQIENVTQAQAGTWELGSLPG